MSDQFRIDVILLAVHFLYTFTLLLLLGLLYHGIFIMLTIITTDAIFDS